VSWEYQVAGSGTRGKFCAGEAKSSVQMWLLYLAGGCSNNWDERTNGTGSKHGKQIDEQTYTRYILLHGGAMGFLPASSVPGMLGVRLSE
jgi:hypothetical protein